MESTATTGLQELSLNKTPAASDQDLPLTRAPADVDQESDTDNQHYGASSLTKDANDLPLKAVLPSTQPTIAPKQDSFRFLVTTNPTQFKDKATMRENRKHVMNDFLSKERRKAGGTRDARAEGPVEVEKRRRLDYAHRQVAKTPKNFAAAVRGLDTVEVTPDRLDLETQSLINQAMGEWPEDWGDADKSIIPWNLWNGEARSHSPDESANSPERPLTKAAGLVSLNDKADLFVKPTSTDTVEDLKPLIKPEFPSSSSWIAFEDLDGRMYHKNEKSHHVAQPEMSEKCSDQPVADTALACDSMLGQSQATVKRPSGLPLLDSGTLSATPKPESQDHVRNNPFRWRLQQLLEDLASEEESSSESTPNTTDSDDTSSDNDHPASYSGYNSHNGAPNSDSPGSSVGSRSNGQHASGSTSQTSCNQSCDSSRTGHAPRVTQGYGDNECVRTSTRQTQNDQENGKVIPCPLKLELKCAGADDNMSSLLRELSNSTHNIFYCNRCKSLLSRITHTRDAERLRDLRKEAKERWQVHIKSCHDDHCVMSACAAQSDGEVRHKHNENCKTNRDDEKEADANYLYRTLGVAELGVDIGSKSDHKGKRKSTARKIASVAEGAVERNIELESELLERKQELEKLKQINRDCDHRADKLRSANEELCSIIRHALEDMRRANVDLTNALLDRIKRHAPIALRPPDPSSEGTSYANNSFSYPPYPPVDTPYGRNNALPAASSIANGNDRRHDAPMNTFSLPGPSAKRRRGEIATHDGQLWDYQNPRTYLPGSEKAGPVQNNYNSDSTDPATGALASTETSDQTAFAAGASLHQFSRPDSIPSQRNHQQASSEAHNGTNQFVDRSVFCGYPQPGSPMLGFESSTRHNLASPPLPQPMSGEQYHSMPDQLPWMGYDQGMMDSDFFDAMSEPHPWEDHFSRSF